MFCFVAFLRGINVGGHIVVKGKLLEVFSSLGFKRISTFRQSGNVIFESSCGDPKELEHKIEGKLFDALGFKVAVFVRTFSQLKAIIDFDAFKDQSEEGTSFLVTFLPVPISNFPLKLPVTIPKSAALIISANSTEVFSVTHGGGEGALPNPFLESKLNLRMTTRNINTVTEILKKYS
jgi:uncharacterized protein (DUF1697 family)